MNREIYNIKLTENTKVVFPNNKPGNVFICGFVEGMFGEYDETFKCFGYCDAVAENNIQLLIDTIKNGYQVRVLGTKLIVEYMNNVICDLVEGGVFTMKDIDNVHFCSCGAPTTMDEYGDAIVEKFDEIYKYIKKTEMKFDYIIQNPPYKGSLHLDFLEKGLDLLKEDGKMVIIEPATWLINVRKNGKAKRYDEIKKRIEGHVESVVIENLNKDFNIAQNVPFATTTIDMSNTFDTIDLVVCGEHQTVKSIYDCNLIGNYATVWSILEKCQKFGDTMDKHVWDENENSEGYITFMDICSSPASKNATSNATPDSKTWFTTTNNGGFFRTYFGVSFHPKCEITSEPQRAFKACGNSVANKLYSDKLSKQLYGTREELENWKHFIFNNKLPLFLNIILTIDQNNNSKPFLPWLVDKQYTDEEINKIFGFTEEEIKLIDFTIKKYERNSPWFKRYMCGPDSVSDDEVNNFIEKISK